MKGKDRQIQLNSHKKNTWQAESAANFQNRLQVYYPNLIEYIFNLPHA